MIRLASISTSTSIVFWLAAVGIGIPPPAARAGLVEDRSGTEHFAIRYQSGDYRAQEYPASATCAERTQITPSVLRATKLWLEESYAKFIALKFKDPVASRASGRVIVWISRFPEDDRRGGFVRPENRNIYLNLKSYWRQCKQVKPGQPPQRMSSVVAHELFHVFQLEYDRREERWLLEATAQWGADQVYSDNDAHLPAERRFLENPQFPLHLVDRDLDTQGDVHTLTAHGRPYGSSLFVRYVVKHHPDGDGFMHKLFERLVQRPGPNSLEALAATLASESSGWGRADTRRVVLGSTGVRVTQAPPGYAAHEAGLQVGDVILRFNHVPLESREQLTRLTRELRPGSRVTLRVRRGDNLKDLTLRLSPLTREGQEIPVLGIHSENLAAGTEPITHEETQVRIFDAELADKARAFREWYDRFAAACVMGSSATPEQALPDAASLKMPPAASLDSLWHAYCSQANDATVPPLTIDFSEPRHAAAGWIGGIGSRYFRITPPTGLPADSQLVVEVKSAGHEASLQCVFQDGGKWRVVAAQRSAGGSSLKLNLPQFEKVTSGVTLVVARYADSVEVPGVALPLELSLVKPGEETVRLEIRQGPLTILPDGSRIILGEVENMGDVPAQDITITLLRTGVPTDKARICSTNLFSCPILGPGDYAPFRLGDTFLLPKDLQNGADYNLTVTGKPSAATITPDSLQIEDVKVEYRMSRQYGHSELVPTCRVWLTVAASDSSIALGDSVAVVPEFYDSEGVLLGYTWFANQAKFAPGAKAQFTRPTSVELLSPEVASFRLHVTTGSGLTASRTFSTGKVKLEVRVLKEEKEPASRNSDPYIRITGTIHNTGEATIRDPFVEVFMASGGYKSWDSERRDQKGAVLPPGASLPFEVRYIERSPTAKQSNFRRNFPNVSPPLAGGIISN